MRKSFCVYKKSPTNLQFIELCTYVLCTPYTISVLLVCSVQAKSAVEQTEKKSDAKTKATKISAQIKNGRQNNLVGWKPNHKSRSLRCDFFFKWKPHVHKPQATKISPSPALSAKKGHIFAVFVVYVVRHCKRPPMHYPTSRWADGAISR